MKRIFGALAVSLLLSGCSFFGEEVPDGFSQESYEDMVNAYRAYEKQKIANEKTDGDSDVLFEYRELGDQGKLTEEEKTVRDLISELTIAYSSAYMGLTNETYGITELAPNKLTVEIGTGLDLEEIREAEEKVLAYLELEPLPINQDDDRHKRAAHNESANLILQYMSLGEQATPIAYEDSYIVYRKDRDVYYVASAFAYEGKSYKYDMILDGELAFVDAYMADDTTGVFSKPMNDDMRPNWSEEFAANETDEAASAPAASGSEEGQTEVPEDIYGDDQEVPIDENGTYPDEIVDEESGQPADAPNKVVDPDFAEWDKELFLGGTMADISATLSAIRQLNADAMSMDLDVEYANETIMNMVFLRDNLEMIAIDPETSKHLSESEKETIYQILGKLSETITLENLMISDQSTQNILTANSTIEDAMSEVDRAQFEY